MTAAASRAGAHAETDSPLTLRPASGDDAARVWEWNFAPDVRAVSRNPRVVLYDHHARWWAERLIRAPRTTWIVEAAGVAIGLVRIEPDHDGGARAGRISIVLAPGARGRGVGRRAIAIACARWGGRVIAEIAEANAASRAAFEAAGFRRVRDRAGRWSRVRRAPSTTPAFAIYRWSP